MLDDYIRETWAKLRRNALDVALDPKLASGFVTYLYIPPAEDPDGIRRLLTARHGSHDGQHLIEVRMLPHDFSVTEDHGLLYLPHDYIVPGGRFNEMYAWDSYWIILGLLRHGLAATARGMIDNFLYEIRHYGGKVLNGNRTYMLARSHPPLLAAMIMAVLPHIPPEERKAWLREAADGAAHEYEFFWKTRRYDAACGLFHYGSADQGALGACPEAVFGERNEKGEAHYDKIAAYLQALSPDDPLRLRFCDENGGLTLAAFAGDRAMRESGFDTSMQMGYYGLETISFSPVCLNSLLVMQSKLLARMYEHLDYSERAQYFAAEAAALTGNIQRLLWNEEAGLFFNLHRERGRLAAQPYLTCVYPLWAGIATPQQARRFRDHLSLFETPYGIKGCDQYTGCQWDSPFMWAPLVYFTVAGLQNYGYQAEARRIAGKFLATVQRVYDSTGANFEKYNADTGSFRTEGIIDVGYGDNVIGFGWTNGLTLLLQEWLERNDGAVFTKGFSGYASA